MPSIYSLGHTLDVVPLLLELAQNPQLWNKHKPRTTQYKSAHTAVSDIWVRYNDWKNYNPDRGLAEFNKEHLPVWYPAYAKLPSIQKVVDEVLAVTGNTVLGGVLITRISPGGQVAPHRDGGWHATHYNKYAVQLMGNEDQGFYFEDSCLKPYPGDLYTFDNSQTHWVLNNSRVDRMTLIICARKSLSERA